MLEVLTRYKINSHKYDFKKLHSYAFGSLGGRPAAKFGAEVL